MKMGYGEVDITRDSKSLNCSKEISKSLSSNVHGQRATCSETIKIATDSSGQEDVAPIDASRNSRAIIIFETAVTEKVFYAQENVLSGTNPADNIEDRSVNTVPEVVVAGSIERGHSCLGSRFTSVSPKVGLDVSVMRLPSNFVIFRVPNKLDFDDAEASSMLKS
ncbi:unnamed protein product [Lupinus luteus]|uniref:Uncharacterized protein n=1 Tax=Lupinus luteus TaxID=3873 RepID=A0AAV1VTP4_LUPLU